jgi:hypothetical protein
MANAHLFTFPLRVLVVIELMQQDLLADSEEAIEGAVCSNPSVGLDL